MYLSKAEIRTLGKQDIKYKRALACLVNLHNFQGIKEQEDDDDDDDILHKLECSCIRKATCSCPYMEKNSEKDELCKHILAALLKFYCCDMTSEISKSIDHEEETTIKSNVTIKDEENHSQSSRKRKLPSWMNSRAHDQGEQKQQDRRKRVDSLLNFGQRNKKSHASKKRISLVKRTVYCMTPEDFIKTAKEIIKENEAKAEDFELDGTAADNLGKPSVDSVVGGNEGEVPCCEADVKRDSSQTDDELEMLMFNSSPAKKNSSTSSHQIHGTDQVGIIQETQDLDLPAGDTNNSDWSLSENDLENLMFGSSTRCGTHPHSHHLVEASSPKHVKETFDSTAEVNSNGGDETLPQNRLRNIGTSQSDSQQGSENCSILDELMKT